MILSSSPRPYVAGGAAQASFAGSSAARFGGRVNFGMAAGAKAGAEAAEIGVVKTLRVLHQYFKVAENRQIVKGLVYQYGIPAAIGLSFFAPPLGWIIGTLGVLPSMYFAKRGEQIINKLASESLDEVKGPLAAVTRIKHAYERAQPGDGGKIIHEYNRLVDELLIDNDKIKNLGAVRNKLKLAPEGRLAKFLNHVFNVNLHYANRWQGKVLKKIRGLGNHIPVKFIKWPIVGASLIFQGVLVLLSHNKVKSAAVNGLRRLV